MIKETVDKIRTFSLFEEFSNIQCAYIKQNASQLNVPHNQIILNLGEENQHILFLLEGELKLTASDGKTGFIQAESKSAKHPIAQVRPSHFKVETNTDSIVIILSSEVLDKSLSMGAKKPKNPAFLKNREQNSM